MSRMGIVPADVTKVFLTHLHSDHVIDLPELYLSVGFTRSDDAL